MIWHSNWPTQCCLIAALVVRTVHVSYLCLCQVFNITTIIVESSNTRMKFIFFWGKLHRAINACLLYQLMSMSSSVLIHAMIAVTAVLSFLDIGDLVPCNPFTASIPIITSIPFTASILIITFIPIIASILIIALQFREPLEQRSERTGWRHQLHTSSVLKIKSNALEYVVVRSREMKWEVIPLAPAYPHWPHNTKKALLTCPFFLSYLDGTPFRHSTLSELQMGHFNASVFIRETPSITHEIGMVMHLFFQNLITLQ